MTYTQARKRQPTRITTLWRQTRRRALMSAHPYCAYCNIRLITWLGGAGDIPTFTIVIDGVHVAYATLDHIVPLVCGGQDTNENTLLSCADCNERKGHMPMDEFIAMREKVCK